MHVDLTGIALAVIATVLPVVGTALVAVINARIKDVTARATLAASVKNAMGAIQQGMSNSVTALHPAILIPGVPLATAIGVQYVLDHAGDEAARFGITPAAIADKITAQIGLTKLAASPVINALPDINPAPAIPVVIVGAAA